MPPQMPRFLRPMCCSVADGKAPLLQLPQVREQCEQGGRWALTFAYCKEQPREEQPCARNRLRCCFREQHSLKGRRYNFI